MTGLGRDDTPFVEAPKPWLSVIMPLAPKEEDVSPLLNQLKVLGSQVEVLVVAADTTRLQGLEKDFPELGVNLLSAPPGRASCMNSGSKFAVGSHLLFLHADSQFDPNGLERLIKAIQQNPQAVLYFDLAFSKGSHPLMRLNEWGALFRCRVLHTPFGDQGLCMSKSLFEKLGGYPENLPYGEDHMLIRMANQLKIPVVPIKAPLYTSSRKYQTNGWLKTTLTHLYLWRKQAGEDL